MSELVAGVDLGGTAIKLAIADRSGTIIQSKSIPTDAVRGPDDVLARIASGIEMMLSEQSQSSLSGLGMGVPGLVDVKTGIVQFLPNLHTQWRGVRVAEYLSSRFQCPVQLLNDARAATLGELRFGHGKSSPDITFAYFGIGTGIGGGVVIDGKLRLGPLGAAGELGHQTIVADGPLCGCSNYGCLETLAGGAAITAEGIRLLKCGMAPTLSRLTNDDLCLVSPKLMAEAAREDAAVMSSLRRIAQFIGIGVANVVTILHPSLIVIGGGVAEMGDLLFDTVRSVVRQRVGMFPTDGITIARSQLGDRAGIVGAVALAMEAA